MAYRIDASTVLIERASQLLREAEADGQFDAFRQALIHLRDRLAFAPFTTGEFRFYSPSGSPVYLAASGPVSVFYVVFLHRQTVSVLRIDRLR